MKWVYGVARAFLLTFLSPKKYGYVSASANWRINDYHKKYDVATHNGWLLVFCQIKNDEV
jgi:hypothetical protein